MLPRNYEESLHCVEKACQIAGLSFKYIDSQKILAKVTYQSGKELYFLHNKNPFNSYMSARICQDKSLQHTLYQKNGIKHPKTKSYFSPLAPKSFSKYKKFHSLKEVETDILSNFSFPFILKKNQSSLSKDVFKVMTKQELEELLKKYFQPNKHEILVIQEYIQGREVRVISLKGNPLLAYTKGTKFSLTDLKPLKLNTEEFEGISAQIYKHLHVDFSGIDLIQNEKGIFVIETNSNPACFYYNKHNGRDDFIQVYLKCLQEYQN